MKGMKCTCMPNNLGWFIVQSVIYGFGAIFIVLGLQSVWVSGFSWAALVWVSIGFLVHAVGKLMKNRTHAGCPMYLAK